MSLMGMKGGNWKSALIVQGIDFRPKALVHKQKITSILCFSALCDPKIPKIIMINLMETIHKGVRLIKGETKGQTISSG